ncbi:hypothetical protein Taro_036864 [Colocasia esculenta]|uniref:F-box domain-containing protein n=1 Tax=Colocasia esculenta TaxID=4460 RepID=A0A843VYS6_COLES|nr:hypothetical protein [Colocasia esculenta]
MLGSRCGQARLGRAADTEIPRHVVLLTHVLARTPNFMDPLIPGLPDEVALECLLRVPYTGFRAVRSTCKQWRAEVQSPGFYRLRRAGGHARTVVAFTQSEQPSCADGGAPANKHQASSAPAVTMPYRISLFEPDTGAWDVLPGIPGLPHGLPLFCRVAGAGRSLIVVGGWEPSSWAASDEVFVYDFVSGAWRRGARMPGPRRSFFACASDADRMVLVAGGHDDEKNALRSALAYDVVADEWAHLPDMALERDECKGVFRAGALHVVGGYSTEMQGRFGRCSEAFDVATQRWGPVEEDTLETGMCPRSCVASGEGLYRCREGQVEAQNRSTWCAVAEVPEDARLAPCLVAVGVGRLVVVGSACHGGPHACYLLEEAEEGGKQRWAWRRMAAPEEYSGHVQDGCCLDI